MIKIGALQPGYLPWLGFFEQIYNVDKFVMYDDVQYTKQDWRSRNRIKTANGVMWLTVPTHGHRYDFIKDVKIANNTDWRRRHVGTITHAYGKANYFNYLMPSLETIITKEYVYLVDLDMALIYMILEKLGIRTELIMASDLAVNESDNNLKIVKTIKKLQGDHFYEGKAGMAFIDRELFKAHGIRVEYQEYRHPIYPQLWGEFVSHLSVIDLLFNCGPESLDYIIGKKGVAT